MGGVYNGENYDQIDIMKKFNKNKWKEFLKSTEVSGERDYLFNSRLY